jgi:hypothetical protein
LEPAIEVQWADAHTELADADLLLFRCFPRRLAELRPRHLAGVGWLISTLGRGPYSHAALVGRLNGDWYCMEVREWIGGRISALRHHVQRYPGQIDVYSLVESVDGMVIDRTTIVDEMKREIRPGQYGWFSIAGAVVCRVPFCRWLHRFRPDTNPDAWRRAPVCSEAVHRSVKRAYWDLVPRCSFVEPCDLMRSALLTYKMTLVP